MARRNRGKPKPKIRDLSRQWPTPEEVGALVDAFASDDPPNPIVTAILGVSMIEFDLEKMLRPKFRRQDDETWGSLTGENGTLSGFYSKILAGYAFGLYDETILEAMHTARRIRNAFAHSKKLITFDHELVAGELRDLVLPSNKKGILYKKLSKMRKLEHSPQAAYTVLCLLISNHLSRLALIAMKARVRGIHRKLSRLERTVAANPFSQALVSFHQSEQATLQAISGGHQTGGPSVLIRQPDPSTNLGLFAELTRNKGK